MGLSHAEKLVGADRALLLPGQARLSVYHRRFRHGPALPTLGRRALSVAGHKQRGIRSDGRHETSPGLGAVVDAGAGRLPREVTWPGRRRVWMVAPPRLCRPRCVPASGAALRPHPSPFPARPRRTSKTAGIQQWAAVLRERFLWGSTDPRATIARPAHLMTYGQLANSSARI